MAKPVDGGTSGVCLDQPFLYIHIHRLFSNSAEIEKGVLCRYSFVTIGPVSDAAQNRACSFLSLHNLVSQDHVTYMDMFWRRTFRKAPVRNI